VKRGRDKEALAVIAKISSGEDVSVQLKELQMKTTAYSEQSHSKLFKEIFYWKYRYCMHCCLTVIVVL
jgi:hypothetical protein